MYIPLLTICSTAAKKLNSFRSSILGLIQLFPTQVWHGALCNKARSQKLNRELLRDIKTLMTLDQDGWKWSRANYPGGYTSYASITNTHLRFAPFMELKSLIDRRVREYARTQHWDLQARKLEMTTCWVNVMPELVSHSLHLHPLAVVSGTYYVKIPKGSGPLKFEDPRIGLFMGSPPRNQKCPSHQQPFFTISPNAGELALWESWLRHEVAPNRGTGERVSVSFNYEWI